MKEFKNKQMTGHLRSCHVFTVTIHTVNSQLDQAERP